MKLNFPAAAGGRSIAALVAAGAIIAMLSGCGGGGGGGGGSSSGGGSGTPVTNVVLSGSVSWSGNTLPNHYVSVVGASPVNATLTDSSGNYSLTVPANEKITLAVQENAGDGCTVSEDPTDFTESVTVGGSSTQTANLSTTSTSVPPPPICANARQ